MNSPVNTGGALLVSWSTASETREKARDGSMTLKTYRGNSMAEALAQVKKDLGGDAVILHTRSYRVGGIAGFGGKTVIEITASDQAPAATLRAAPSSRAVPPPPATLRPRPARRPEPVAAAVAAARDRFEPLDFSRAAADAPLAEAVPTAPPGRASELAAEPQGAIRAAPAKPSQEAARTENRAAPEPVPPTSSFGAVTRAPFAPIDQAARRSLEEELGSIKRLVGQVLQCTRHAATRRAPDGVRPGAAVVEAGGMEEPLFDFYLRLTDAGVSTEIVEDLIGRVRDELEPGELRNEAIVAATVERRLAERIRVVGNSLAATRMPDGRPLTVALVGPTGVGKTTTIAKLAATCKLRHGKKVGLVTSDTYRIAAVDQLRVYANIIGLPLKVAMNAQEVAAACESLGECDCILIDTAGRSQHDAGRLDELRAIVAASHPHETHLVLSAAAAEPVLLRAVERFAVLNPDRLIFTKLDEAVQCGALANVAIKTGLAVSYLTTGQEVPEQIELADAPRLARRVLGGGDVA